MSNRRSILDFPRNEAGLVDEFIGTAYDAMYAIYQNLDALLNVNLNTEAALNAAAEAKESALAAAAAADRAKKIVDDFEANGNFADFTSLGIYTAQSFGLVGGATREESLPINKALDACGKAGGGVVLVRAKNAGDPVYINKPVQIEYDNVHLVFESNILYGPKGTMRVSGGYKEIRRTELGQVDLIALASNSTVDSVGEMQFTVRPNEGRFLRVGDRVTLRGENNAVGNALEKQTVTIKAIDGDVISCYDVPEYTFRAVYPNSEWEPDKTTGTTVSIVNYSAFTLNSTGPDVLDVTVDDGSKFTVGELVYVSDARKERDIMQERTLVSAAIMEHAMIAKIVGNVVTFDRPLQRQYLKGYMGGISSLDAVFNSHITIKELSWSLPQPDRKNSCVGINFGWKCSVKFAKMEGRSGRVGTALRIAYSFDCEMYDSEIIGGYAFASAETYGAVMYYSTFCRLRNSFATGSRHNFLIQTCVSCDILDNISTDDYVSGIDLHGAGALNCRIMGNRISRSKNYAPDANIGGGIRNGNTSHVIGDHGTLIYNNYIEGYNNRNDSNGRFESAAIDLSPASQGVIVRDNHMVDCSIGFRHYRISETILEQRVTKRIILIGNTFERISQKLIQMNIGTNGNTLVEELVLIGNKSVGNSLQFEIEDVPKVRMIDNQIVSPIAAAGVYGFVVKRCTDLVAVGNFAAEANRGFRIEDCPGAKVFKNILDLTREGVPFTATGTGNTGYIERGNTMEDSGGSGATIQIGTVITGIPGSQAQVVNVGTPQDAIFNFVIPRGDPGQDGGGTGGDYTPSQNVQDLDALVGAAQSILMFNGSGRLAQFATGAEGRSVMAMASLEDLKLHLDISQVNNTPDSEKPVSTPQAEALAAKANLNGPKFTGRPETPNPALETIDTFPQQVAPAKWVLTQIDSKIAEIPPPPAGAVKSFKTIALLGDSLSGNNSDLGKMYTRGFLTFAQQMSGHRLYSDHSLNFGVGGQTAAQIAARVGDVIAKAPDICLIEMGGNDINSGTSAASLIASMQSTIEALVGAGIRVIVCTIYSIFGNVVPANLATLAQFNQWILDAADRYNLVEVLDAYSIMVNPATNLVRTNYTYDQTHPGTYGAWILGRALAQKIEEMIPTPRYRPLTNLNNKWVVSTNVNGNILTNPGYTGTSGTIVGTGGSGTIPTGLELDMSSAKGVTAAVSVISGNDGFNTLEITLGGQATGTDPRYTAASHITLGEVFGGTTAWNTTDLGRHLRDVGVNQLLQMECEVENLSGVIAVGVESFHMSVSGTSKPSNGDGLYTVNQAVPTTTLASLTYPTEASPTKLILRAEPEENTGKANGYKVGLHITCAPGVPVTGKIRISRPIFRGYAAKLH